LVAEADRLVLQVRGSKTCAYTEYTRDEGGLHHTSTAWAAVPPATCPACAPGDPLPAGGTATTGMDLVNAEPGVFTYFDKADSQMAVPVPARDVARVARVHFNLAAHVAERDSALTLVTSAVPRAGIQASTGSPTITDLTPPVLEAWNDQNDATDHDRRSARKPTNCSRGSRAVTA